MSLTKDAKCLSVYIMDNMSVELDRLARKHKTSRSRLAKVLLIVALADKSIVEAAVSIL